MAELYLDGLSDLLRDKDNVVGIDSLQLFVLGQGANGTRTSPSGFGRKDKPSKPRKSEE